jgi:hypothetical protein
MEGATIASAIPEWVPAEAKRLNDLAEEKADGTWRMTKDKLSFLVILMNSVGCLPEFQKTVIELLVLKQEEAEYIVYDPLHNRIGLDNAHPYIAQRN